MDYSLCCCSVLMCATALVVTVSGSDITVKTNIGTLTGIKEEVLVGGENYTISKFLGIPYAEPPVGPLRFRFPVAKAPFQTLKIFQKLKNQCIGEGDNSMSSEDCLYLNLYLPDRYDDENLAVMIFIHGGGFVIGSGNDYCPDILSVYGNVIVVTFNYRLSVWGFLSTGDSNSIGNYGLWDQRLAIKWVKDNIEAFGGDSNRITIFGESAGAASVIYQGMFPGNKGLFQRMIPQSGTASAYWATAPNPETNAKSLALRAGCNTTDIRNMIDCLRNLPTDTIMGIITDIDNNLASQFLPTVDNVFVPCRVSDIIDLGKTNSVYGPARDTLASFDLLIGMNSGEGGYLFYSDAGVYEDPNTFVANKTYFDTVLVPICVELVYSDRLTDENKQVATEAVIREYTDNSDPTNPLRIREEFVKMHTDSGFRAPILQTVDAYVSLSRKRAYVYLFNVEPSYHILPTTPSWFNQASHADELMYVLPISIPLANPPFDDAETAVAMQMMTHWANFAKSGDPNNPKTLHYDWPPFSASDRRFLDITRRTNSSNVKAGYGEEQADFWNTVVAAIVPSPNETCAYIDTTSGSERNLANFSLYILFLVSLKTFL